MTKVPQGAFKFDIAATRKPDDSEATEIAAGGRASMQEMGDRKSKTIKTAETQPTLSLTKINAVVLGADKVSCSDHV